MANSSGMKWCLLIVACIGLYVYQNQSNKNQEFATPQDLRVTEDPPTNESYTTVPVRDPLAERLYNEPSPTINEDFDSVAEREVDIPFQNSEEINLDVELSEEGFFDSEPETLPTKLPAPKSLPSVEDRQVTGRRMNPNATIELPDGVQSKVVQHIEYGKSLARRGAMFGAKNEFHSALRLVAQSIDYKFNTKEYSDSLYEAQVAMEEADDFYFAQGENNGKVDVVSIGLRHNSKILDRQQLEALTPVDAMQSYYDFVQNQLVKCSGKSVVAGEALFCLGRMHSLNGKNVVEGSPLDNAKAIVHHRAALQCDSKNYKSANELAVLLVKAGRLPQAKKLLIHSLKINQVPAAWQNLALIHQQLGENRLASIANAEYQRMLSAPPSSKQIKWVSPQAFAADSKEPLELRTANATIPQQPGNVKPNQKQPSSFKNMLNRLF